MRASPSYIQTFRYEELQEIRTHLNALDDMLSWLNFLTAMDYVVDLCRKVHGLPEEEAKTRARKIRAHVRYAKEYFEQALGGASDLAFLPGYYGLLNLLKCYVLLGPHHQALEKQRTHGVSYSGINKRSAGLLTDTICLHPAGAAALFYRTVVGIRLAKKRELRVGELYPYIADIEAEYGLSTGNRGKVSTIMFSSEPGDKEITAKLQKGFHGEQVSSLKVLRGYRCSPTDPLTFIKSVGPGMSPEEAVRQSIRQELLYAPERLSSHLILAKTALSSGQLLLPEELPIALAWFHMSSVVRYHPEFLARLRDSREWAMLDAMRRHSLLRAIILFLSFAHKKTISIS